jgi:hypothetical protein
MCDLRPSSIEAGKSDATVRVPQFPLVPFSRMNVTKSSPLQFSVTRPLPLDSILNTVENFNPMNLTDSENFF